MEYTAVIRTLGTAGEKYSTLLNSLARQTILPSAIYVYIAEGYPLPKETIGCEKYIYVKKGMLAQRALNYEHVTTEYLLMLDDDLKLPDDAAETMLKLLEEYSADAISPDIFTNSSRPLLSEIMMTVSGRMRPRRNDGIWGYKVMLNAGYSYNKNPKKKVYQSQTNAGACVLCRKEDFLKLKLSEELWVDKTKYPLGEDQVMYYKMYLNGYKLLTYYNHNIEHLDGGNNRSEEKEKTLIYSDFRFKTIFWHRFIFKPEKRFFVKFFSCLAILYTYAFTFLVSVIKGRFDIVKIKYNAIKDGVKYLKSDEYKELPLI